MVIQRNVYRIQIVFTVHFLFVTVTAGTQK